MSEPELLGAVNDAMSDLGMTLTRQEPSPFERALAKQVLRRMTSGASADEGDESGPWWVAGQVITRDDKQISLEVQGDFETPEERRQYMSVLCEVLNRAGLLLD